MMNVLAVVILACIAAILTLLTIVGNAMVILAFKINRKLRILNNYCLVSLAVSDLTVGLFLMPVYTVYLFMGYWPFGSVACNIWLSMDYALCTASLANLLIIALDRYLLVTHPLEYKATITRKKMGTMIISAWIFAILVWPPWIFAWPYIEGRGIVPNRECYVQFLKTNPVLTTIVSFVSFYIPVTITVVLYVSLFLKNEQRRRHRKILSAPFTSLHNLSKNKRYEKTNTSLQCCMCCSRASNNGAYNLEDNAEQQIKVVGKSYQIEVEEESLSHECSCVSHSGSYKTEDIHTSNNNNRISDDNHSTEQNVRNHIGQSGKSSPLHEIGITRVSVNTDQLQGGIPTIPHKNTCIKNHTMPEHLFNTGSDRHNNKRMVKILSATLLTLIISNAPYYTAAIVEAYCSGCVNLVFYGAGKQLFCSGLFNILHSFIMDIDFEVIATHLSILLLVLYLNYNNQKKNLLMSSNSPMRMHFPG